MSFAQNSKELYRNATFVVKADMVSEGKFLARVKSANEIVSDYLKTSEIAKGEAPKLRTWTLTKDISTLPQFESDLPIANAMYNLSLEEMLLDIRPDSAFMAGKEWEGVWTRDISYSIFLSLAMLKPENAKISLMKKVQNGMIIQDTGTGGSYPVSTDRMTWALAAYEVYVVTGDKTWLRQAFDIIKKSAEADQKVALDKTTGLFLGESSFLDWREQTYPKWMEPKDIYNSTCLGTNAVHFQTYRILEKMASELGENGAIYKQLAENIKSAINRLFWIENKKYYGQFRYGGVFQTLSDKSEALGEALTVLFDIAPTDRKKLVLANTPVLNYGIPCIYPQIAGIDNYHNNGIWSFVQSFWNWAAAKGGNEMAVQHGIAALYRQTALFLTNKENMVAETGNFDGTVINSDRQLWSVAGNLATVYRIFLGMDFQPNKLVFSPFVPKSFDGLKIVRNFSYRQASLNITVKGYGNKIKKFTINGTESQKFEIDATAKGKQDIVIELTNTDFLPSNINLVENKTSPITPRMNKVQQELIWETIQGAYMYEVFQNGKLLSQVVGKQSMPLPPAKTYCEYQVRAISLAGVPSFLSMPFAVPIVEETAVIVDRSSLDPTTPPDGMLFSQQGQVLELETTIKVKGRYAFELYYSNTEGPINTDNKCAMRTLLMNDKEVGTMVMPQRGQTNDVNYGYSNAVILDLVPNTYKFSLVFLEQNKNMNGFVNTAIIQKGRLRKID